MAGRLGLMAGALSRGIGDSLAGVNQGLLQGEEIRRGRAQEDLHQAYLQQAQQNATNQMLQQAIQNAMAQQHLGLARDQFGLQQLGEQRRFGHEQYLRDKTEEELGIKRGEAARKLQREPLEEAEIKARTGEHEARSKYYSDPNVRNPMLPYQRQAADDRHKAALAKIEALKADTKMTMAQRVGLKRAEMEMRKIGQAKAAEQAARRDGVKFSMRDPQTGEVWTSETLAAREAQVYADLDRLSSGGAAGAGGAPATDPWAEFGLKR